MIAALVINLETSIDRLDFQQKQLARLHIPMQRLPAFQSAELSIAEYESQANGWERKLRVAELACFLSHKAAWKFVLDTDKPWLILEDDAFLAKNVNLILPELLDKQKNFDIDYVTLETRNRRKWIGKKSYHLVSDYQMRRLYQDRSGAAAYVLFPSGARKLLSKAQNSSPALADAFLCRSYELNAWQIYPAAAIQLDQCINYGVDQNHFFTSTISPSDSLKPSANGVCDYLGFKMRRIVAQCRMGWRQLSVYNLADRSMIPIIKSDFEV
ncbi:MAG: glycosyltransferase family 25 protein [Snodgrassella sp.]|nr:glycosyltransferase family 25 protein [Snodgrassella sp.]